MASKQTISETEKTELLETLKNRFTNNKNRHPNCNWKDIEGKLEKNPEKLWSLLQMEKTGGEPDIIQFPETNTAYFFVDCSAESPKDRRSFCYDKVALDSRKENKPSNSAIEFAKEMKVNILSEEQYRHIQTLENFDLKTSSWVTTPEKIRKLGGAIFCDRRYDTVFTYHNGANSYYAARGFRAFLEI